MLTCRSLLLNRKCRNKSCYKLLMNALPVVILTYMLTTSRPQTIPILSSPLKFFCVCHTRPGSRTNKIFSGLKSPITSVQYLSLYKKLLSSFEKVRSSLIKQSESHSSKLLTLKLSFQHRE